MSSNEISKLLSKVQCSQEYQRIIFDLILDYESLQEELEKCIEEGGKKIEIKKEPLFDKPHFILKKGGEKILLCLN